jgi:hypothetical protein
MPRPIEYKVCYGRACGGGGSMLLTALWKHDRRRECSSLRLVGPAERKGIEV